MKRSWLFALALLLAPALPTGLLAQEDDAAEARYAAAAEWVKLVLVEKEFEKAAAQAHETVAAQLTAEVLQGASAQLGPQLGELESLEPREQSMQQGLHLVVMTGVFANGTFDVQVFMGDDHRVAGFFVRPPGAGGPQR
jgi:hypothetical protein